MKGFIILIIILCIYFLPAIVVVSNKHKNGAAVIVLNLLLGWTLIGWIVALIWAIANGGQKQIPAQHASSAQELEKLAELKAKGVISEEEFQARKKKVLES